ncbi:MULTISPECIES: hypothetical protein [unclassified Microbacterium]|uniref:hypothetical protein n=1 Tax=unclassified Microbacterium TaxID=2609290 RepID=UPI0011C47E9B|nr:MULTISPECIES: hypothetical protein [unclassified Microbacterium]MBT2485732.1 hypothetical protein [Microbacterium sp. ISL-108]
MAINTYLHGRAKYRVLAPCVVVDLVGGGQSYVYRNGYLPASTRPSVVEHLLEQRSIESVEAGA